MNGANNFSSSFASLRLCVNFFLSFTLLARRLADDLKRGFDVAARRAEVDDAGAQGEAAAQRGVRHVSAPAALHRAQDALVQLVRFPFAARALRFVRSLRQPEPQVRRQITKTADAQLDGREQLEVFTIST